MVGLQRIDHIESLSGLQVVSIDRRKRSEFELAFCREFKEWIEM